MELSIKNPVIVNMFLRFDKNHSAGSSPVLFTNFKLINIMKVIITQGDYGFSHNWTLVYNKKQFFLGQDVKFCNRVLGIGPRVIIEAIGTDEINNDTIGNKKLAKFIVSRLGLTKKNIKQLNTWELCAQ